ncbi:MAG: IS1182 family transposase [Deltaproteobacteria bacterium]|nr:IS1182 family transposase [Deltaproteobacteria bacterium]
MFREKIWPKLLELGPKFEALYCAENGRPPIDPVLLCGVTLLQFIEKVADRRASEQVVYHLGWKYALDLELDYGGFHATVLVYFRDRLEEQKAERMIFDGVVDLLIELGLVKRKGKQRLDSTHIVGYVKAMSWMECAMETLRLALEDLKAEVGKKTRPEFWDRLWALYVENNLDWRLSKPEQTNRHRQCGQDMRDLLEWIATENPKLAEREAVQLLRRVLDEQFEVVEGKLELITQRPPRAVHNPHDPDAHYADKKTKQWTGYKVHVAETVDPQEPIKEKGEPAKHFITEMFTTEAAQDEMAGLTEVLKREQEHHEIIPDAMYTDAGYVTEHTLTQAEQNGLELLGPCRPDPHKGPYNSDAFQVDVDKRQAVCPQGNLSSQCSRIKDNYQGTEYYRIEWGNQCDGCPVQKQCTHSKNGRRTLVVGLRHDLVERRRREMKQSGFSKSMHPRNGIEATHSELLRGHGMRQTKYRGLNRVGLSNYFMGAACNVKRYLSLLAFQMRTPALSPA